MLEKSCHEFHLFLGTPTNFTCTLFHAPNFCLSSITVLNFYVSSYKQLEACRSLISTLETKYPGSDFPCLMRASLLHREKHSDKAIELLKVCYFLMLTLIFPQGGKFESKKSKKLTGSPQGEGSIPVSISVELCLLQTRLGTKKLKSCYVM